MAATTRRGPGLLLATRARSWRREVVREVVRSRRGRRSGMEVDGVGFSGCRGSCVRAGAAAGASRVLRGARAPAFEKTPARRAGHQGDELPAPPRFVCSALQSRARAAAARHLAPRPPPAAAPPSAPPHTAAFSTTGPLLRRRRPDRAAGRPERRPQRPGPSAPLSPPARRAPRPRRPLLRADTLQGEPAAPPARAAPAPAPPGPCIRRERTVHGRAGEGAARRAPAREPAPHPLHGVQAPGDDAGIIFEN
jgi:hypothetical protein